MTKPLEVGMRVKMVDSEEGYTRDPPNGTFGRVVYYQNDTMIQVHWKGWAKGFNSVGGIGSDWWVERKQLRKLPDRKEGRS